MRRYDPDRRPNPREWLALDEGERLELAKRFHRGHGSYGDNLNFHAAIHAVVETQLAENVPPVKDAYRRLKKDGLDRHSAIHAIGSVLAEHIRMIPVEDEPSAEDDPSQAYFDDLTRLTSASWLARLGAGKGQG